jgi:hypothetical protein
MKRALLVLPALALAAGCASSGVSVTTTANHPPPRRISVPGCLPTAPPLMNLDVATDPFIRPGAVALRLCEYHGFNWGGRGRALRRARLNRNTAAIAAVIRKFDALPLNRKGTFHCPNDDGSELGLLFFYPDRSTARILVQLTGCGEAVGKLSGRDTTLRLRDMLVRLVRG